MSDDDIIARGGTQDDIDSYAENNGATSTNQADAELRGELLSYISASYDFHGGPGGVDEAVDEVMHLIKQWGIQERIDALSEFDIHKEGVSSVRYDDIHIRIVELTTLKDKENES